jgi:hypothetical protein
MGHGGAWGDIDGDGLIDLFVGGFADRPNAEYAPAAGAMTNKVFRNSGDEKFAAVDQARSVNLCAHERCHLRRPG